MPTYVVYLDQVLLGSLVMNYAILWVVARFIRSDSGQARLLAAAALGSIYSAAVFIPALSGLLTLWHKALVSVLMVGISFGWRGPRNYLACLGCFYLASFTLGGAVWGFIALLQANSFEGTAAGIFRSLDRYFWYGGPKKLFSLSGLLLFGIIYLGGCSLGLYCPAAGQFL